jgi:EmrB/QacA subfamily drug resistance transporter
MIKKINYKWIALSCTSLGAFMSILNGSTLIIALPDIMKDLKADMNTIMWTIMGYLLVLTIIVPAVGRIADMIGRKMLFVSGFIIFTIGSLICGFSRSGLELLLFRLIQGLGGALLIANSAPIVTDAFPRKELGRALGINSMIISIAFVIGPILGGYLVQFGWRSIFFINVPIGVIGTAWAWIQLKELDKLPAHQKFDWAGTLTFTAGMLLFLIVLSFGGFIGWLNPVLIAMFVLSLAFLAAFIYIENHVEQPMLDMRLLKTRLLAFSYGSVLLNGIARGALTFLLVFYYQGIRAMDPLIAGIMITPFAIPQMIVSPISGWLSDKYGSRILSSAGLLISGIGLIGFIILTPTTSYLEMIIWMLIMGFGSGMFFSPNTSTIMGSVPVEKRGIAAGVRTMMNNSGTVISIALAMAVISTSITPEALQGLFTGTQVGSKGIAVAEFMNGLRIAFTISLVVSLIGAVMSFFKGKRPDWKHDGHVKNIQQPELSEVENLNSIEKECEEPV